MRQGFCAKERPALTKAAGQRFGYDHPSNGTGDQDGHGMQQKARGSQTGMAERTIVVGSMPKDAGDGTIMVFLIKITDDGRIYLTQTRQQGRSVIRVQVGQFDCTADDVTMIAPVVADLSGP